MKSLIKFKVMKIFSKMIFQFQWQFSVSFFQKFLKECYFSVTITKFPNLQLFCFYHLIVVSIFPNQLEDHLPQLMNFDSTERYES